jgi:hypothetical protein
MQFPAVVADGLDMQTRLIGHVLASRLTLEQHPDHERLGHRVDFEGSFHGLHSM